MGIYLCSTKDWIGLSEV